ncbi:ABC-type Fe3+-hydroxamate transport system, substrate-binding protein [Paenibacillus sp. UNCCL117]|uniref:AraC family transcriptional regulator n=1 Tax=unclassified Paenibacillus TaxID=185978 RepID=UPI00087F37DA|nr:MULTISPECIES: AraC family transcriptional regulator [unclassified Paenibacillus]SDC27680.1 ABC-type Fe3+-hydroxamate transport system, substrate-binding protein [Paenibacillus sp. cl123]SFW20387.1 ABC-type Fe3+-hydroxamate transport system, substrate-binding protein [Paenibacillus sp. UNCCL117]
MPDHTASFSWKIENRALLLVIQGKASLEICGRICDGYEGTGFMLPPGSSVQVDIPRLDKLQMVLLQYQSLNDTWDYLEETMEFSFSKPGSLQRKIKHLMEQSAAGGMQALQSHIIFQQLMLQIWKERPSLETESLWEIEDIHKQWSHEEQHENEAAVERTISYIHEHYAKRIQIGALARDAHMTRWHFGHLFKSLTGQTPMDYLTALRIVLSKQLMSVNPDSRLRDIAVRVGFQDEFYYSRRFKKLTGISPNQFKAQGAKPPRMVCIQYLGELLSLGIRPVAANRSIHQLLEQHAEGIHALSEPLVVEEIMALQPDLILYPSYMPPALVSEFRRIATSVEISWKDDVAARLHKMGTLFGKEQAANEWIASYANRAEYWQRVLHGRIGPKETAVAFVYHLGLFVYTGHHFGHTLYSGLGFEPPDRVRELIEQEPHMKWKRISLASIHAYAADRIFMAVPVFGPDAAEVRRLLEDEVWLTLPAVKAGRVSYVDLSLANYNPITLEAQLETIGTSLLEGSEGERAASLL